MAAPTLTQLGSVDHASAVTSFALTTSADAVAGDVISVAVNVFTTGTPVVTDSAGNTYQLDQSTVASGFFSGVFSTNGALPSGGSITVTGAAGATVKGSLGAYALTGCPATGWVDQTGVADEGVSSAPSVSAAGATSMADEIVIATFFAKATTDVATAGAGYTLLDSGKETSTSSYATEYATLSAIGTPTADLSWAAAPTAGSGVLVTYKGTSGGGGSPQTAAVTGLGSVAALGTPGTAVGGVTEAVTGIDSQAALGAPAAAPGAISASPAGLSSSAAIGALSAVAGNVTVTLAGLGSAASFGIPSPGSGSADILVSGLDASPAFGGIVAGQTVPLLGLDSAAAFGTALSLPGAVLISPAGVTSAAQFGSTSAQDTTTPVAGVPSAAQFGVAATEGGQPITFNPAILGGRSPTY